MPEIFTLSGPADGLGEPVSALDQRCATGVRTMFFTGVASGAVGVGTGLFGTYKLLRGRGAAGVTGILGAAILVFASNRLLVAAARGFETCRRAG